MSISGYVGFVVVALSWGVGSLIARGNAVAEPEPGICAQVGCGEGPFDCALVTWTFTAPPFEYPITVTTQCYDMWE
jgi:hypothetical protein